MMATPHTNTKAKRQCADCGAEITAYGNRKRCDPCQEAVYRQRQADQAKRRRAAKRLARWEAEADLHPES